MYTFGQILQYLAYLIIIIGGVIWAHDWWLKNKSIRDQRTRKDELKSPSTWQFNRQRDEEEEPVAARFKTSPIEAQKYNLDLMGVPDLSAGEELRGIPAFDPAKEGDWNVNQQVLTTSRILIYTHQGARPMELFELSNGYLIWCTGRGVFLLKKRNMSMADSLILEKERKEAVDSVIKDVDPEIAGFMKFLGISWKIAGAYGDNMERKGNERDCSFIEVLTTHPRLGEDGFRTSLPSSLISSTNEEDYFDVQAVNTSNDEGSINEILYGFFAAGAWSLFIGRQLKQEEIDELKG